MPAAPPSGEIPQNPEPDKNIPVKVLIAEDEADMGPMIEMMIGSDSKVTTVLTERGDTALEILRTAKHGQGELPFDLVISDLGLPGLDGFQLAETVQNEGLAKRFTLFTGRGLAIKAQNTPEQLKTRGVDNVISKPSVSATFIAEIAETRQVIQSQSPKS
jgi:CheY-like chemotaxis protein